MNIALCDDDGRFRAQTARSLTDILEKRGIRAAVGKFRDAEELLAARARGETFDLYLLDIIMPGMDGVTLARQLRAAQPKVPILFFTTSPEFAVEAFSLGATHYVVKPFTRQEFAAAIARALENLPAANGPIVFRVSSGVRSVRRESIVYCETDEHYQHVRLTDGTDFITRISGQELWSRLEGAGGFVRAGLRYIFNLSHVTDVGKNAVTLAGGKTVSVPRRAMPGLKAAYLQFCCG